MDREIREMLKSIQQDGVKYMPARDVIVQYDGEGFNMWIEGEEYGYYPTISSIVPDIKELQNDRPFVKGEMFV